MDSQQMNIQRYETERSITVPLTIVERTEGAYVPPQVTGHPDSWEDCDSYEDIEVEAFVGEHFAITSKDHPTLLAEIYNLMSGLGALKPDGDWSGPDLATFRGAVRLLEEASKVPSSSLRDRESFARSACLLQQALYELDLNGGKEHGMTAMVPGEVM